MELLVAGKTSKQIGYDLGISSKTVDIHRSRILSKTRADSIVDLVHMVNHLEADEKRSLQAD